MDEHGEQLATLDQLGIGRCAMALDRHQEPAVAEEARSVNNAGTLLVVGEEGRVRRRGAARSRVPYWWETKASVSAKSAEQSLSKAVVPGT
jgi:hypothetical protein